ncbi:hypothetical protein SJ05684_c31790 [Sinorhizobium sojae CCBAU 05684]|uniref:Uncharacterized protein n=1 Tax=Sinorhizobium sojae CCBAU 05684 TaxID=716928 RepID=A0A249PF77_9HYPH|nr:hypothetical protein SJ05684_c31790 [Sinorhizobium sojae CCBAU 05684]
MGASFRESTGARPMVRDRKCGAPRLSSRAKKIFASAPFPCCI